MMGVVAVLGKTHGNELLLCHHPSEVASDNVEGEVKLLLRSGDEISKVIRCSYYFSQAFIRICALGTDYPTGLDTMSTEGKMQRASQTNELCI
jgi:hypothetical protein